MPSLTIKEIADWGYVVPNGMKWHKKPPKNWRFHNKKNYCKWQVGRYNPPGDLVKEMGYETMEACKACFPYGVIGTRSNESHYFLVSAISIETNELVKAANPEEAITLSKLNRDYDNLNVYPLTKPLTFKREAWVAVERN